MNKDSQKRFNQSKNSGEQNDGLGKDIKKSKPKGRQSGRSREDLDSINGG